jgi:hypothetical protein
MVKVFLLKGVATIEPERGSAAELLCKMPVVDLAKLAHQA